MRCKTVPGNKKAPPAKNQGLAKLIQKAQRQPGVQEVMEVYRQYQVVENAARPYSQLISVKRIVSLSDKSSADIGGE